SERHGAGSREALRPGPRLRGRRARRAASERRRRASIAAARIAGCAAAAEADAAARVVSELSLPGTLEAQHELEVLFRVDVPGVDRDRLLEVLPGANEDLLDGGLVRVRRGRRDDEHAQQVRGERSLSAVGSRRDEILEAV